jgi:hypothetical protein
MGLLGEIGFREKWVAGGGWWQCRDASGGVSVVVGKMGGGGF